MAVAVEDLPSVVLDEQDRIVEANAAALPWFGPYVGEYVYAVYPEAEPLFRAHFERARRSGLTEEFPQYYDGVVAHVTAVPTGLRLTVTWETVDVLDTFTLDGLRRSLDGILAKLDEAHAAAERGRVRDSLRIVSGGA